MAKEKVVLAYSGGLDTSCAIKWLKDNYHLDVIAVVVDVGQGGNLKATRDKALKIGAMKSYLVDAKAEFAKEFVIKALMANALYEGKYPLVSALTRPLIAKYVVEIAKKNKALYVAHGSTGKGNDQVRFEVSFGALDPDLKVVAPVREWKMSREEAIEYAKKSGISVTSTRKSLYSIDENLWGRAIECGILEDPWQEPPHDVFKLVKPPQEAPDEPEYVEITFKEGLPVALNGKRLGLVELLKRIGKIAGKHGFGKVDMVENRLVGLKSREVYEAPQALALIKAHQDLESLVLERELLHFKVLVEARYAELIYYGLWYSPLREALDAFVKETQKSVSGTVRLKFYKGSCEVVGRKSHFSLYDYKLATYEKEDEFDHKLAKGFVELWGLPTKVWAKKQRKGKSKKSKS